MQNRSNHYSTTKPPFLSTEIMQLGLLHVIRLAAVLNVFFWHERSSINLFSLNNYWKWFCINLLCTYHQTNEKAQHWLDSLRYCASSSGQIVQTQHWNAKQNTAAGRKQRWKHAFFPLQQRVSLTYCFLWRAQGSSDKSSHLTVLHVWLSSLCGPGGYQWGPCSRKIDSPAQRHAFMHKCLRFGFTLCGITWAQWDGLAVKSHSY